MKCNLIDETLILNTTNMKLSVLILISLFSVQATLVEIQVRRISKRSTDEKSSVSVSVKGKGHQYELNLKSPEASVFSKFFTYMVGKEDSKGKVFFENESPSKEMLNEIEEQIYTDQKSDTSISLKNLDSGYKVHGILNNLAIIPVGKNKHKLRQVKVSPEPFENDYIDLKRNITNSEFSTRAILKTEPEVWVVFDYENSLTFGHNREKILDYLGVFFHAINNRYATFTNPSISFRISGVTIASQRSSQPFMENNKVPNGNDINKVLDDFSKWTFANQGTGPKFDMAALISGVDFQTKDSNGVFSSGVAGLAYLSSACWKTSNRFYSTSATEDSGGYFDGVFSVAHEFSHNLGAFHDGQGDASSCSWDEGYIMSYKGWGTLKKFYFSPCSINLMRNYISSTQGTCLRSLQSSTNIPISSSNVGDRFSMTQLCIKYTNQPKAVPEPTKTPNDLCKNLSCRYPTPGKPAGYYSIITLNHPPGDDSPCGGGGKCVNGNCVTSVG